MRYENMEALNAAYPERAMMGFEEELRYIEDCYDTMEGIGFKKTFDSPYEEYEMYNGKCFTVVRRLSYPTDSVDMEVLPMWDIQFADGTVIHAYPEEICKDACI